jgi:carbamate kinase
MNIVTLGGNAILPAPGKATFEDQIHVAATAMSGVADLIEAGNDVVISHGNGPIVGNIVVRNEAAKDRIPPMPLDICGADSQGGIGYMLQQVLHNALSERNIERTVVTLVTQCVVDADDPAFENPTKPIGPYYTKAEASELARDKGWRLVQESDGFRRVVPSPRPIEIIEWRAVRALTESGTVVIVAGGGGVPVLRAKYGKLRGVEAVIDKDWSAAILAQQIGAERLLVLTAVPHVALDYGLPTQRDLKLMTTEEAKRYGREGHFPPGTMGPKIEACVRFVESGGEAVVTRPADLVAAVRGNAGTRIVLAGHAVGAE